MKTASLTQANINPTGTNPPATTGRYPQMLKASANYALAALGEGIKSSLQGLDINVEFMTLTVRSIAQTSGKSVKKIIAKYSAAGRNLTEKRFQYNNNTTLSHS